MEDKSLLRLYFDGDEHEVELNVLLSTLADFGDILKEIKNEFEPSAKLDINIRAINPGSFDVFLALSVAEIPEHLFTAQNFILTTGLISAISNLFNIKKHLKGKKPNSVEKSDSNSDQVKIENVEGDVYVVSGDIFRMYEKNPLYDQKMTKIISAANESETIEGIKLLDEKSETLSEIKRAEFAETGIANEMLDKSKRSIMKKSIPVNPVKLSFQKGYKWKVILEGHSVNVDVEDDQFFEKIDKGLRLAKGDTLIVDLEIIQVFDESVNTFTNKSYSIKEVIEYRPRPASGPEFNFQ